MIAQVAPLQQYVLAATGGEHLIHFRDHGNIFAQCRLMVVRL
jgi:hypothetical protein